MTKAISVSRPTLKHAGAGRWPQTVSVSQAQPICERSSTSAPTNSRFVYHAKALSPNIRYVTATAMELPFKDERFDFTTAFMSFTDMAEIENALAEVFRVLRPEEFLQFSITHPCFDTPHRENLRDDAGKTYAIKVGDYFLNLDGKIEEWLFSSVPSDLREEFDLFRVPRFTRTLSEWLNLLVDAGFRLERFGEPCPSDDAVRKQPGLQDAQVVAYFLHVRARTPPE